MLGPWLYLILVHIQRGINVDFNMGLLMDRFSEEQIDRLFKVYDDYLISSNDSLEISTELMMKLAAIDEEVSNGSKG